MDTTEHPRSKLLVRSRIHEDENLTAYRNRIAQENGMNGYCLAFGKPGKNYQKKIDSIQKIAILTGQSFECLMERAYLDLVTQMPYVSWCGKVVSRKMLRNNPPLCLACIDEYGYIRSFWDLKMVVACPRHRCWLLEKCPSCNNTITWERIKGIRCLCGCRSGWFDASSGVTNEAVALSVLAEKAFGLESEFP